MYTVKLNNVNCKIVYSITNGDIAWNEAIESEIHILF